MAGRKLGTVIGISGVTCGGKTTIATKLKNVLSKHHTVAMINQDNYYKEEHEIKKDEKGFVKWDCVEAVNFHQLLGDVKLAMKSSQFLIVEGILIFAHKELNDLFQLRYFLHLDYDETLLRRSCRCYDPPDVPGLFEFHVWPQYLNYKRLLDTGSFPNLVQIDASQDLDKVFTGVMADLKENLKLKSM